MTIGKRIQKAFVYGMMMVAAFSKGLVAEAGVNKIDLDKTEESASVRIGQGAINANLESATTNSAIETPLIQKSTIGSNVEPDLTLGSCDCGSCSSCNCSCSCTCTRPPVG